MKLKEAQVRLYRNFVDSSSVPIDEAVTCLVGKNESGKTAFLEALYSLKPAYESQVRVNITIDYPRWRKVRDERQMHLEEVAPIEATFSLEDRDLAELCKLSSVPLPLGSELVAERTYGGTLALKLSIPEEQLVGVLGQLECLDDSLRQRASQCRTIDELLSFVADQVRTEDKRTKRGRDLSEFQSLAKTAKKFLTDPLSEELSNRLADLMPTFFYFSDYSRLKGRMDLTDLLSKPSEKMEDDELTALALLHLVGVKGPEFMESDFEVRIAELEAAANEVTRQVFEYWTQNKDLIVDLKGDSELTQTPQEQKVVHRFVDIRLNDLRHQMTTNFETRSSGFQWFFSFIVAFSEFEDDPDVIILLDEPGLGLHARAQADFLRFIEERLSLKSQVLYTSHSPFTVNPKHLERVRLFEDLSSRKEPDIGAKISTDVLAVRKDTLFPLQAALGYDLAQNLFVGGFNLIVEGPSDFVFLTVLSEHLESQKCTFLDPRFTIAPVGGADKIPTFIALLGAHVDVTVLVDEEPSQNQRLQDMVDKGLLASQRLVGVSQVTQMPGSSMEDLFTPGEYIRLYNEAFGESLRVADLTGSDSITRRIERHRGSQFNHLRPAVVLLRNRDPHLNRLSEGTLKRYERLFELLNGTLPQASAMA